MIGTEIETETEIEIGSVSVSGNVIVIDAKFLLLIIYLRKRQVGCNSSNRLSNNKIVSAVNSNFHILIRSKLASWVHSATEFRPSTCNRVTQVIKSNKIGPCNIRVMEIANSLHQSNYNNSNHQLRLSVPIPHKKPNFSRILSNNNSSSK